MDDIYKVAEQVRKLTQPYRHLFDENSAARQIHRVTQNLNRDIQKLYDPLYKLTEQAEKLTQPYKRLFDENSAAGQIRRVVQNLNRDIQKSYDPLYKFAEQAEKLTLPYRHLFNENSATGQIRRVAQNLNRDTQRLYESLNPTAGQISQIIQNLNRDIQRLYELPDIAKHPNKVADWINAGILAKEIEQNGIEWQQILAGVFEPDNPADPLAVTPKKDIFSARWFVNNILIPLLINMLAAYLFHHFYQKQDTAKTEISLHEQKQTILGLTSLVEQVLIQTAQESEEIFVVRERMATVRSEPRHGAAVVGKLRPNEVVWRVGRKGLWIEVRYYHGRHEEFQTGWVLKKYLKRIPANHSKI